MTETPDPSEETETNRRNWESRVPVHAGSAFYDIEGFAQARRPRLTSIEVDEVGDVRGRDLLHLQCHLGIDTLSWALLGATATGVDFSGSALAVARGLARRLDLDAEFVEAEISTLALDRRFDVVVASHGVLCWIGDLAAWAGAAARHLRPGGVLYVLDGHPTAQLFRSDDTAASELRLDPAQAYFRDQPRRSSWTGTYADPTAHVSDPVTYQWNHTLGAIVQAVRDSGLTVEYLHEFPVDTWQRFPSMTRDGGWWRIAGDPIPLLFSIRARKER